MCFELLGWEFQKEGGGGQWSPKLWREALDNSGGRVERRRQGGREGGKGGRRKGQEGGASSSPEKRQREKN